MRKLQISIIDLIHNSPSRSLWRYIAYPNYISIMPQIIGAWCREEGHEVHYSIFTGSQKIKNLAPDKTDLVFISSFTFTTQLAYALSNYFRSMGVVTILGGPHARCYPDDASQYFDYVLGLTDRVLLKDLLSDFGPNKPRGLSLSSASQPLSLPGIRERWEFIEKVHKISILKMVPMIGSFGCPFQCDFCIDSEIGYQAQDINIIKEDLAFIISKMKHPRVSWYDPNFGINFNSIIEAIESVRHLGKIDFIAECSLSVLTEPNVIRLKKNGFKMIMPGIESWFDYGNKSRTGSSTGMDKVRKVAEQVNMIQRYIPQVQTNFMFGLDSDKGHEPFTLTKRFIDLAPGAYPSFALLSVFGQCTKNNARYEDEDRIIPFPFHIMKSVHTLNILPRNYGWDELYSHIIDLVQYSFSSKAIYRRFKANHMGTARWLTLLLSLTIGGRGKSQRLASLKDSYQRDPDFKSFVNKETTSVPAFIIDRVRKDLGPMWHWLPDKSLSYDPRVFTRLNEDHP